MLAFWSFSRVAGVGASRRIRPKQGIVKTLETELCAANGDCMAWKRKNIFLA